MEEVIEVVRTIGPRPLVASRVRVGAVGRRYGDAKEDIEHGFEVLSGGLYSAGFVRCVTRGRMLYVQVVYLEERYRGRGISSRLIQALEELLRPEVVVLHAGSILPCDAEAREAAETKLIQHWMSQGFSLVEKDGNLLMKQVDVTNVSAQGGAPWKSSSSKSEKSAAASAERTAKRTGTSW